MRVVITGPSGIGKRQIFDNLKKLCNDKDVKNSVCDKEVELDRRCLDDAKIDATYDLENHMCEQKKLTSANYLELGEPAILEGYKNETLENIMRGINDSSNVVLGMHATYYRKSSLYHILDWTALRSFKPDMFITLIDDVYSIHSNLHSGDRKRFDDYTRTLTLKDILWWREAEIIVTQMLAKNLIPDREVPHYIVAIGHGTQMIYQLMFESKEFGKYTKKKKVYASYPVTKARESPSLQSDVKRFVTALKKSFIVFNPLTITEKLMHIELLKNLQQSIPDEEIQLKKGSEMISIPVNEVMPLIHNINGQIISRDERLVEQSEMIISLKPTLSTGGMHELAHARTTGRVKRFVVDDDTSPFATGLADKVYTNLDQLLSELHVLAKYD